MHTYPSIQSLEPTTAVSALCRRTGLTPGELSTILTEIAQADATCLRRQMLGETLPCVISAYLRGGYPACTAPEVWPCLVLACVASFCLLHGLAPLPLAHTAHGMASGWPLASPHTAEQAAALMFELDEHMARRVQH